MPEFVIGIVLAAIVLVVIVGLFLTMRRKSGSDDTFVVLDSSRSNPPGPTPNMMASTPQAFGPSDMFASDFRLTIQDIFMIRGRGLVATGKIESGSLQVGQRILIASPDGSARYESQVKGLEAFHKQLQTAQTGDNVGVMLGGSLTKDQVKPGMIMTQQN